MHICKCRAKAKSGVLGVRIVQESLQECRNPRINNTVNQIQPDASQRARPVYRARLFSFSREEFLLRGPFALLSANL